MNAASSRGHAIFQVINEVGTRLCIVDLAGRENERTTQCRGQSLAELSYINKSLFHLTSVIQALAHPTPGTIVPFRNSKLTLFLSDSLQHARTFLLATVSPAISSFDETATTLRLAHAVRHITTKARCEHSLETPKSLPRPEVPTDLRLQNTRDADVTHHTQISCAASPRDRPIAFAPLLSCPISEVGGHGGCLGPDQDGVAAKKRNAAAVLEQNVSEKFLSDMPISFAPLLLNPYSENCADLSSLQQQTKLDKSRDFDLEADHGWPYSDTIPFAPLLSSDNRFGDDACSPDLCDARRIERRRARFRLDAWSRKLSDVSVLSCSTAIVDSRSPTEFGDSDRSLEESRLSNDEGDIHCSVTEVLYAQKLTGNLLERWDTS
jgi:hypothetical protein